MQLYLCNMIHILFDKADKVRWVRNIASFVNLHCNSTSGEEVVIDFSNEILPHELKPFHLTSLACLVQFFVDKNFPVSISWDNKDVCQYVCDTCGFSTYWRLDLRITYNTINQLTNHKQKATKSRWPLLILARKRISSPPPSSPVQPAPLVCTSHYS